MTKKNQGTALAHRPPPRKPGSISDVLKASDLSRAEIHRIEKALRTRGGDTLEVDKARYENGILQESLTKTQDVLYRRTNELTDAKVALAESQEAKEVSDSLLGFAKHVFEEKNKEIEKLRTQVEKGDSANAELHEQVRQIGIASADEATQIAINISAKRTLNLLNGYKGDVAERDGKVRGYESELEAARQRVSERDEKITGLEKEVEAAREQALERDEKIGSLEKELILNKENVAEVVAIAHDQEQLIDRLLRGTSSA